MSFSADWLALRRDADRRARDTGLTETLRTALQDRGPGPIRVLDLGAGTGANMAALAPKLGPEQIWRLVDNNTGLLARAEPPPGVTVEHYQADLAGDLSALFDPCPDLVTASAFFDLGGRQVAGRIVEQIAGTGAAFYTVLTYDGREEWLPPHPLDGDVLRAFHADQRRDKGLGPALGPDATECLARALKAAGYRVTTASSDWRLRASEDAALIRALAEGSASAVTSALGARATEWLNARRAAKAVMIGHTDLLAIPPG